MTQMFYNCSNLISLKISSFNVENTQYLNLMFGKCSNLIDLNLTSFKLNQQNVNGMLYKCNFFNFFLISETFLTKFEIALRPDDDEIHCPYSSMRIIESF
jgi:surface protein